MKYIFVLLIIISGCISGKNLKPIVYNYDSVDEVIIQDTSRYIRVHAGDSLIKIPRTAILNINVCRNLITSESIFTTKIDSANKVILHP